MSDIGRLPPLIALAVVWTLLLSNCGFAGEPVTVWTENGRRVTGEIDSRTDASRLWLRSTEPGILILSSFQWSEIRGGSSHGQQLSRDTLFSLANELKSPTPATRTVRKPRGGAELPGTGIPVLDSFQIDVRPANWDRDAELDGLELRPFPVAADGSVIPLNGVLTVRLIGQWPRQPDQRARFEELGKWTERLSISDFKGGGPHLRLPFRTVNPDFDLNLRTDAQVDARLSINGGGIYNASVPVMLRPYSPPREQLQLLRNRRFFPGEQTGHQPGTFLLHD